MASISIYKPPRMGGTYHAVSQWLKKSVFTHTIFAGIWCSSWLARSHSLAPLETLASGQPVSLWAREILPRGLPGVLWDGGAVEGEIISVTRLAWKERVFLHSLKGCLGVLHFISFELLPSLLILASAWVWQEGWQAFHKAVKVKV